MTSLSALYGQATKTEEDYYIVKGLYRLVGQNNAQPELGFKLAPQAPSGYIYESRLTPIIIGCIVVMLAIIVPVTIRLCVRARGASGPRLGWDDWIALLAAITALGYPITNIVLCLLGSLGVHVWDMTYSQINYATHGAVAGGTIYYVAVGITKLSIALFVRRMAVAASRKWQLCIDFYVAAVVAYVLLALFWNVFTCRPIPAAWDLVFRGRQAAPPVCMDVVLQSKILGGIHIALGVILLLAVPVIVLCRTQMDSARKVRMYLVCTVGVLGVAAGLLRELRLDIPEDSSWDYVAVLAWTSADLVLGLLVASLPILDGLLARPWHTSPAELASISDSRGDSDSKQQVTSTTTTSSTSSHPPSTYTTRQKNRSVRDIAAALGGGGGGSKRVMKRSESRESIMKKERRSEDTAMEMGILCTQEIRVLYTSRRDIASDGPPTPRREHYLDRAEWRESVQKPEEVAAPLPARKLSSRLKRHA